MSTSMNPIRWRAIVPSLASALLFATTSSSCALLHETVWDGPAARQQVRVLIRAAEHVEIREDGVAVPAMGSEDDATTPRAARSSDGDDGALNGRRPSRRISYLSPEELALEEKQLRELRRRHDAAVAAERKPEARRWRDEIVDRLLGHVSHYYERVESDLHKSVAGISATLDVLQLSTSAWAAAGPGEAAYLSALSTIFGGTKEALNKDVFGQLTFSAILDAYDTLKIEPRTRIETGLDLDVDGYPLSRALRDVNQYMNASSILAAVRLVDETSATNRKEREKAADTEREASRDGRDRGGPERGAKVEDAGSPKSGNSTDHGEARVGTKKG